jgi:hypothetical protein
LTLNNKKLFVFATGVTPVRDETSAEIRNNNIPAELHDQIRFFYLRGGFDYSKLKPADKVLMALLKLKLKRKKQRSADERGMLAAYSTPVDFTKKKNIDEIIAYIG